MVLVGAEAVVESGGIVNKLGTYPMAMVAKLFNKPMYCAVESYKFARVYPLTQADLPKHTETPLIPPSGLTVSMRTGTTNLSPSLDEYDDLVDQKVETNDFNNIEITGFKSSVSMDNIETLGTNFITENPACDYTPASYLTLLFTDLGVLTPAAVSDELIRLYQ